MCGRIKYTAAITGSASRSEKAVVSDEVDQHCQFSDQPVEYQFVDGYLLSWGPVLGTLQVAGCDAPIDTSALETLSNVTLLPDGCFRRGRPTLTGVAFDYSGLSAAGLKACRICWRNCQAAVIESALEVLPQPVSEFSATTASRELSGKAE